MEGTGAGVEDSGGLLTFALSVAVLMGKALLLNEGESKDVVSVDGSGLLEVDGSAMVKGTPQD